MAEIEKRYIFTGIIRPERAHVTITFPRALLVVMPAGTARVRIDIIYNQMIGHVDMTWNDLEDIGTLRNSVREVTETMIASFDFLRGYSHFVEITTMADLGQEGSWVFGVEIPSLEQWCRESTRTRTSVAISSCFSTLT